MPKAVFRATITRRNRDSILSNATAFPCSAVAEKHLLAGVSEGILKDIAHPVGIAQITVVLENKPGQ
jgi:hypothetical protein